MVTIEELKTTVKVLKEVAHYRTIHNGIRVGQRADNEGDMDTHGDGFVVYWPNSCEGGGAHHYRVEYLAKKC